MGKEANLEFLGDGDMHVGSHTCSITSVHQCEKNHLNVSKLGWNYDGLSNNRQQFATNHLSKSNENNASVAKDATIAAPQLRASGLPVAKGAMCT